jgi:IS5 family transposase
MQLRQEAETTYEVYDQPPRDSNLLIAAIEIHCTKLGRMPRLLAADAGFYSANNETAAKAMGVKHVCIREQRKRWFRTARDGAPDARDASVWSSGGMG